MIQAHKYSNINMYVSFLTTLQPFSDNYLTWVVRYWCGYLSETRCKWFACGTADATAIWSSSLKIQNGLPYYASLPRLSWKKMDV